MTRAQGMTRRGFVKLAGLALPAAMLCGTGAGLAAHATYEGVARATRTVTDDLGRKVEIPTPSHLERVYFSGPVGQIMLFSLRPELIAGTTLPFTPEELDLLPTGTENLPFMGSLSEDKALDVEMLRQEGVQLVLSAVSDDSRIEALEDPDAFQEQSGIPVLQLNAGFDTMGDAYRLLGDIVGAQARAEELARYCEGIYARVSAAVDGVPVEQRVRLYYAEGPDGLQTEPFNSAHAYTFGVAGAYNVAKVDTLSSHGMTNVTIKQVREWDPEVIIAWDHVIRNGADDLIRDDPEWKGISAVDSGRVYTMPNAPYSWCDRPAGPNRCIGIQWVANLLYPDYYDVDMVATVRDFYQVMWNLSISEEQARELLRV